MVNIHHLDGEDISVDHTINQNTINNKTSTGCIKNQNDNESGVNNE